MDINLTGKKAIITGSTVGIGYAIAKGLAHSGATVLINGRTENRVYEAVDRLKKEVIDAEVYGLAADLSNSAGVKKMTAYWPHADILVNNIGLYEPKPFFEISDEKWEQYFQVNLMSAVRMSRHYAQEMVQNGWGRILFNASATSGFISGEMVHYGATKSALLALSRGLAESIAGSGVTVNAFLPGPTRTEKVEEYIQKVAESSDKTPEQLENEMFSSILPTSLLKRFIDTKEVADLVVYISSDHSSAITGAALRVDGGIMRSIL